MKQKQHTIKKEILTGQKKFLEIKNMIGKMKKKKINRRARRQS